MTPELQSHRVTGPKKKFGDKIFLRLQSYRAGKILGSKKNFGDKFLLRLQSYRAGKNLHFRATELQGQKKFGDKFV